MERWLTCYICGFQKPHARIVTRIITNRGITKRRNVCDLCAQDHDAAQAEPLTLQHLDGLTAK